MNRAVRPIALVLPAILCLAGCGGNSASATFPPKSESDLHALANESQSKVSVVGHDETSTKPRTSALFVIVPAGLTSRQQVSALLKVLYDNHLDSKVGHQIGSAVVLGYRTSSDVGNRFNAGRVELDAAAHGRTTVILNANDGTAGNGWRLSY